MFSGPLHLVQKTKRGKPAEKVWLPIFLVHAKTHRHQDRIEFELDGPVEVNLEWLDEVSPKTDEDLRNDLLIRLGLLEETRNGEPKPLHVSNFEDCWLALLKHVPELKWHGSRNLRSPVQPANLSQENRLGIYPRVLLFEENLGSYNKGLIEDLRAISEASDEEIERSALPALFPNDFPEKTFAPKEQDVIVQTSPLNPSQRKAVGNAMSQPISVVQGPPGTGKSTVVRATLLTAGLCGETTIFASKNHRAVDAVVSPLNNKPEDSSLVADLREGKDQRYWIELLLKNLDAAPANADDALEQVSAKLLQHAMETKSLLGHLSEICLSRERLSEVNDSLCQRRESDSVLWEEIAEATQLPVPPTQAIQLCKTHQLPWFYFRRIFHAKARRRLVNNVRLQNPNFEGLNSLSLIEVAQWQQLHQRQKEIEGRLRSSPDINELGDAIFDRIDKQIQAAEAALPSLPGAWASKIRTEGALLTKIRVEARSRSLAATKRLREVGRQHLPTLLPGLPLWAITNLSVHRRVPATAGAFNLAIIDEAGQCDPASVLPLIFRAQRIMIVGDPQQLRPIGGLAGHKEDHLRREYGIESHEFSRFGYSGRSAYEMAHDALLLREEAPGLLQEHYRCHPEIAEFFNKEFYDGNLLLRTTSLGKGTKHEGIRWTNVPGGSQTVNNSRWHPPQVKAIVEELKELAQGGFDGTVGVVTPFAEHAKRIRDEVHRALGANQTKKWDFVSATADGFQGGEKDLIIFGLIGGGDGPTPTPPFYLREQNRFNVAVSRARNLLHIFGDLEWARNCEIRTLSNLARASEESAKQLPSEVRTDLIGPVWEPKLAEAMSRAGIEFQQQYPACGMYLDFGLFPKDGRKINVEVDGETYHRDRDGNLRAEDIQRDLTLRANGWTVQRFWVYELREDMEKCIQIIKQILNQD